MADQNNLQASHQGKQWVSPLLPWVVCVLLVRYSGYCSGASAVEHSNLRKHETIPLTSSTKVHPVTPLLDTAIRIQEDHSEALQNLAWSWTTE
jgi:hypothetical protein